MKTLLISTCLLVSALFCATGHAELYKWVDKDGVVHYGDRIPPEYTNDPHEQFNQAGVKIAVDEGELSKEEVAARAEKDRINQQGLAYDEQLLKAYEQVSDIERLREARLADLKQQDDLANNYLLGLEKRQKDLEIEAKRYNYPYDPLSEKPPVPDNLTRELMDTAANVEKYRDVLARRIRMREELVASFNKDIQRFQELKSKH
ncbi:MAG: DUF4124 domain-containing protein [Gammaproteobacteria bacterium]|nr:DUF4124 domain-containing protein [Gammaproteobacteria bacterium]